MHMHVLMCTWSSILLMGAERLHAGGMASAGMGRAGMSCLRELALVLTFPVGPPHGQAVFHKCVHSPRPRAAKTCT